ncbi:MULTISPECIES: TetR/AcrR family transcriptional regulator [unclassified Curtobacterium]|uniref:TetR/AcrR family transcriptional regulator n=1 Tax=unclassified Curtobacterium TaxID=257496 RepID=UPI000825D80C|nr:MULTISPECIES: TetR/AcrR family transcriptional regulator [unclassified Curtobacterium]WIA95880.1 TetR/AcrR family transcriptional regulator [Curtobacterium sp. MCBA15_004]WIA99167.1 TetR/AcrR family transcriptional regulator [Curtobacterium sp. MCBA15_012]
MPRKPDPTLKPAIIEKVARHLLDTKLEDVSVRSLGRVLGTSAYPIVYHFGSREALVQAVVEHLSADVEARTLEPCADADALADHLVAVFGGLDVRERALAARLTFELGSVESLDGRDHESRCHRRRVDELAAWCRAHGRCPDEAERTARALVEAARGAQWGALVDPEHTDVDAALRALARDVTAGARLTAA